MSFFLLKEIDALSEELQILGSDEYNFFLLPPLPHIEQIPAAFVSDEKHAWLHLSQSVSDTTSPGTSWSW
jgi:hypothetical protein